MRETVELEVDVGAIHATDGLEFVPQRSRDRGRFVDYLDLPPDASFKPDPALSAGA